jgi:WD40 repeat protein
MLFIMLTTALPQLWSQGRPDIVWMKGGLGTGDTHPGGIAISADGRLAACAGLWGIQLWNVADGTLLQSIDEGAVGIALSPDSKTLYSAGSAGIRLWNIADGTLVRTLAATNVESFAMSPDGSILAAGGAAYSGSQEHFITLWSADDGHFMMTLAGHTNRVKTLAFSTNALPDHTLVLASGSDDANVKLWRISDGSLLASLPAQTGWIAAVAFSPDGTTLAVGGQDTSSWYGTVRLWHLPDLTPLPTLPGGAHETVTAIAFSPDSTTLAVGRGLFAQGVNLWRLSDHFRLNTITSNNNDVKALGFVPDGSALLVLEEYGDVVLRRVPDGAQVRLFTDFEEISDFTFSPDDTVMALLVHKKLTTAKFFQTTTGTMLWETANTQRSPVFSPDSKTAYLSSGRFVHVSDGSLISTIAGFHFSSSVAPRFCPMNDTFLTCDSNDQQAIIEMWNVSDGKRLWGVTNTSFEKIDFSPDGKIVALFHLSTSDQGSVDFRQVVDGARLHISDVYSSDTNTICISPNWTLLADGARLLTAPGGTVVRTLSDMVAVRCRFSTDGNLLAIAGYSHGSSLGVSLCRASDGEQLRFVPISGGSIADLSSDSTRCLVTNRLTTIGLNNYQEVSMWNTLNGTLLWNIASLENSYGRYTFSPDWNLIVEHSPNESMRFHRTSDGLIVKSYDQLCGSSVVFSPGGGYYAYERYPSTLILARNPYQGTQWPLSVATTPKAQLANPGDDVTFSAGIVPDDGKFGCQWSFHATAINGETNPVLHLPHIEADIAGYYQATMSGEKGSVTSQPAALAIRIWRVLTGSQYSPVNVIFSPDGAFVASCGNNNVGSDLHDISNGQFMKTIGTSLGYGLSSSVACSFNGSILAIGRRDGHIELYQIADGTLIKVLLAHSSWVTSLAFSRDGSVLVSGSYDTTVKLWQPQEGKLLRTLAHGNRVNQVAFSPDDRSLASASMDKTVKLWNIADGAQLRSFNEHTDNVTSVTFSPDGALLASACDDGAVRLWQIPNGNLVATLLGHTHAFRSEHNGSDVTSVAFSPDGETLLSAGGDGKLILWRLRHEYAQYRFSAEGQLRLGFATFSPDGRFIAYGNEDGEITLINHPLPTEGTPSAQEFHAWLHSFELPADGSVDFDDPDHDGMNNWQEWCCQTNPTNALSVLHLLAPVLNQSNVVLRWNSVAGINYVIERNTNLSSRLFLPLATNVLGEMGTTTYSDTNIQHEPVLYRVGVWPLK